MPDTAPTWIRTPPVVDVAIASNGNTCTLSEQGELRCMNGQLEDWGAVMHHYNGVTELRASDDGFCFVEELPGREATLRCSGSNRPGIADPGPGKDLWNADAVVFEDYAHIVATKGSQFLKNRFSSSAAASHVCVATTIGLQCWVGVRAPAQEACHRVSLPGSCRLPVVLAPNDPATGPKVSAVLPSVGPGESCMSLYDGSFSCFGVLDRANRHQIDPNEAEQVFRELSLPGQHSYLSGMANGTGYRCALSSGVAMCSGLNQHGQLGVGHASTSEKPTFLHWPTRDEQQDRIAQMSLAETHACFVSHKGDLYCWGKNALPATYGGSGIIGPTRIDVPLP
jgi:hypothetical protein